ncbi:MAG: phenylalanine--tRNA ligase subunit beta [Desulfatitalea sp.]|nr:phenylalanine--tRNA ligase subunit beta [Desulfatitalea sp.]
MKVSLSWLNDYVTVAMGVDALAHQLTMAGLEVEGVEDRYDYLDTVVVGRISAITPHPNADKLRLCQVQIGGDTLPVVCGAPNAAEGMLAPLALPGSHLPDGTIVAEGAIRGRRSAGMLCSAGELGLGDDRSGLMALAADLKPGTPLNKALGLSDAVLEISITPNRPDCLSIIGIAREVAGFQADTLRRAAIALPAARGRIDKLTSVIIEAPDHCPRYAARLLDEITVGPSPFWLQDRLQSVGLRPINNIVDITNFILMETGQPLHAFDFDHLEEQRIVVRTAHPGERFTTLDGKERQLTPEMLMICDGRKPVAVGGVMGGLNSEIEANTTRVLIESAYFNPASIRKTAKLLGLKTEASHRFERGVDPHGTCYALDRAAQLMTELGSGRLIDGCIDVTHDLPAPATLTLSVAATNRVLGTDLDGETMGRLLQSIEFQVTGPQNETLTVSAPTFRVDVSRPEDLMEEVARRAGYDQIPVTFPAIPPDTRPIPPLVAQRRRIRQLLVGMGFAEIITYSFIGADADRRLRLPEGDPRCRQLAILNPLTEDQAVMRTSLVPGLLETMRHNLARQSRHLKLFEIGKIFISRGNDAQPLESDMLAGLWTGNRTRMGWHTKPEPCDFFDLKGAVEGLLAGLHVTPVRFTQLADDQCAYTCAGATAKILVDGQPIGLIGQLHPQVADTCNLRQTAFIFEMDLPALLQHIPADLKSLPLPRFPATTRDATLIVDKALESGRILDAVQTMNEALVEGVQLFDLFEGRPIPEGRKSLSLRIVYRSPDATLEDGAVNQLHKTITDHLVSRFKADLPV